MIGNRKRCSARLVTEHTSQRDVIEKGRHDHSIPSTCKKT